MASKEQNLRKRRNDDLSIDASVDLSKQEDCIVEAMQEHVAKKRRLQSNRALKDPNLGAKIALLEKVAELRVKWKDYLTSEHEKCLGNLWARDLPSEQRDQLQTKGLCVLPSGERLSPAWLSRIEREIADVVVGTAPFQDGFKFTSPWARHFDAKQGYAGAYACKYGIGKLCQLLCAKLRPGDRQECSSECSSASRDVNLKPDDFVLWLQGCFYYGSGSGPRRQPFRVFQSPSELQSIFSDGCDLDSVGPVMYAGLFVVAADGVLFECFEGYHLSWKEAAAAANVYGLSETGEINEQGEWLKKKTRAQNQQWTRQAALNSHKKPSEPLGLKKNTTAQFHPLRPGDILLWDGRLPHRFHFDKKEADDEDSEAGGRGARLAGLPFVLKDAAVFADCADRVQKLRCPVLGAAGPDPLRDNVAPAREEEGQLKYRQLEGESVFLQFIKHFVLFDGENR